MDPQWNLQILSADLPVKDLSCLAVGDIDGDGHQEIFTGGNGGLWWLRPDTFERGLIDDQHFGVGLALADVDGDGQLELVAAQNVIGETEPWRIVWYKPGDNLHQPWHSHTIDVNCHGHPHDIYFVDIDQDGELELIANACYWLVSGLYIYKPGNDPTQLWRRHTVIEGMFSEGVSTADLNRDGKLEIIHGADYFIQPEDGPYTALWQRFTYAPNFREMCRTATLDITGNGRADIVITDSEYPDGYLSWFENRLLEDPTNPWIEHRLENDVVFSHSLNARHNAQGHAVIFAAEMAAGGWDQPYNHDARLLNFISKDQGKSWESREIYRGQGTHQAVVFDIDNDGQLEIVGKEWGNARQIPKVQIWKKTTKKEMLNKFQHNFLDRDKPYTGTDILSADLNGDGQPEIICGAWWYRVGSQERHTIPGVYQVHTAYDLDGDGADELIATKKAVGEENNWYAGLSCELVWLKARDLENGFWQEFPIGTGTGDWPHGSVIAPWLPKGQLALVVGYHSAHADPTRPDFPEIFEIPIDPTEGLWPKRILAEISYGEEIAPCDINGNGLLDIVAGSWWLENQGDGNFIPHQIVTDFYPARLGLADLNGNGRLDLVLGEEVLDFENQVTPWSRLAWFENPVDPTQPWPMHLIDKVRCAHSISVADLNGDGQFEVITGEHDPFKPYRSRCRLLVYKKANPAGTAWWQFVVDDRFEHHDGAKVIQLADGQPGIISHGWQDSKYVHLWKLGG